MASPPAPTFDALLPEVSKALEGARVDLAGKRVAVFLSGGADSLFLLHALHRLGRPGLRLFGVSIDYGLRDEESRGDAEHARRACESLGLDCRVIEAVPRPAGAENIQAWARGIRCRTAQGLFSSGEADYAALGHQRDDLLEGVLLKWISSQIPRPLAVKRGRFLRPLLSIGRREIEAALRHAGIAWRTDSSNRKPEYRRNRLRLLVLPELDRAFPAWRDAAGKCARAWSGERDLMRAAALDSPWMRAARRLLLVRKPFRKLAPGAQVALLGEGLRAAFPRKRFSAEEFRIAHHVVMRGQASEVFRIGDQPVEHEKGRIYPVERRRVSAALGPGTPFTVPWRQTLCVVPESKNPGVHFSTKGNAPEFLLRSANPQDRFTPAGQKGPVRVRRWLMSHHLTRQARRRTLILLEKNEVLLVLTPGRRFWVDVAFAPGTQAHAWTLLKTP